MVPAPLWRVGHSRRTSSTRAAESVGDTPLRLRHLHPGHTTHCHTYSLNNM